MCFRFPLRLRRGLCNTGGGCGLSFLLLAKECEVPRGGPHVLWPGREHESPSISALRGGVGAQQVTLTVRALSPPWAQGRGGFSDVIHQKLEGPCSLSTVSSSRPESLLFLPYWSAAGLAVDWGVTYHPASFPSFCKLHCLVGAVRSLDERDLFIFPF